MAWRYVVSYQGVKDREFRLNGSVRRNSVVERVLLSQGVNDMEPKEKAVETHRVGTARIPQPLSHPNDGAVRTIEL